MAIDVRGLVKSYRTVRAVDDISFSVADGAVFGFLGSNGAGKSTTIACLTTVRPFDAGTVSVAGHDVVADGEAVRRAIGVVFQDSLLDPALSVRENLRMRAALSGIPRAEVARRIDELAGLIELTDFLDRRYGQLSGGQRRRADIARALLPEPGIVFLDEPTAGLDPSSRAAVWRTIHTLRKERGLTVFLTTHYMEETEEADEICIVDRGRIVAEGTPAALRARYSHSVLTIRTDDEPGLARLASERGLTAVPERDTVELHVEDAGTARGILDAHGDHVRDFEFRHGRMDDVFLAVTGRTGDGEEPERAPGGKRARR